MGITIHYGAKVSKSKKAIIPQILNLVESYAIKFGYEYQRFNQLKGFCKHDRIFDTNDKISQEWFSFWEFVDENNSDIKDDYKESCFIETETKKATSENSIVIHNKKGKEYLSESFEVGFFWNPFIKKYEWNGFTKTQIFNERETIANLKFHIFIIKILEQIKLRFLPKVKISDEGDYFFTEEERQEQIKSWRKHLKDKKSPYHDIAGKYLKKWEKMKPYSIKTLIESHGSNLALIGSISGKLQGLGYNQTNIHTPVKNGIEFLDSFIKKVNEEI
jgi:hypothetical protein